jgi:hypothetical protein
MSAFGVKRTLVGGAAMFAFDPKPTLLSTSLVTMSERGGLLAREHLYLGVK